MNRVLGKIVTGSLRLSEPAVGQPETSLKEAVQRMNDKGQGSLVITDDQGRVAGIFTQNDLMARVNLSDPAWQLAPVGEVMTRDPRTVSTTTLLRATLCEMDEGGFRNLPVVNADGKLMGMVSVRDILLCMADLFPKEFLNLPPNPSLEAKKVSGG
jgi:CBS domain-containing protein